jgi:carbonic anhydrase
MCINCESNGIGRRDLMKFGAAAAIALATAGASSAARAAEAKDGPTALSPQEALVQLKAGNERFVSHPELCTVDLAQTRSDVAGHQAPWATIVACADSRVPPELIFGGHGVGELFIARDAGNLVDVGTLGTIEYGAAVLGSPLIVILAHTACGAVKAACDIVTKNATYPGVIGRMIEPIVPAALAVRNDPGDFADNSAKESAKRTAANLPTVSKIVSDLVGADKVKIVAAIYDLQTGVVTYLD